ncbi:unnamed protein product [Prorocentrum cordatum]|uniref:MMS19 nucleotide excision repair protein n=1 Tax=Prorocentrum cordatum TaxID=2364126 RepID=A0ABN9WUR7_9DINO|nr:unnamed protein product [Polarella glacialis]
MAPAAAALPPGEAAPGAPSAPAAAQREVPAAHGEGPQEGECVQEIVYCLLDAKGGAASTQAVQVAINASVIQVAKANFPLVVTSIFSFLENRQSSELHQLWLLRLLCQVLETRRSHECSQPAGSSMTIDRALARNLTHHLVREVARLVGEDPRQQAVCDVLVELAPMYPDVVLSGVLTMLDNCGSSVSAPPALVNILTEIAYTTPHVLEGRIHDAMSRFLPLLQACKTPEMKLLLFRAWCSLCVAMVNCGMRESGQAMSSTESTFSRCFGSAALELRRRRGGDCGGLDPAAEETDDRRRASTALSTAFTILMSSWQSSKDLSIRVGAMETLGHLCLVIPKDQFLTNADALLELLVNLLTRQSASLHSMPPMRLMRGLCLFLQSCIDADPEILLLENTLQTLTATMFSWTANCGPLQYIQGSVGTEALQSQAEVLRCFDVLADTFQKDILAFLLAKVKGSRDDRLGSLLVLRHLIGSSWRPRPAAVIEGIQQLTGDADPAVGLLLSELIVALAAADFLTVSETGGDEDGPRLEHVHALLSFLIGQTALTHSVEAEQPSYVAKFVGKNQPADLPSCREVRGRAGLVLGHLAGSLKPPVRLVLWPMLLQTLVNPAMRPGLPVLCRAVTQIVDSVRPAAATAGASAQAFLDLAQFLQPGHERSTQPEALLMWLLICAHSPHETPGLGLAVLRCLESLSPLIHRMLGEIWEAPSRRLQTLCAYLEESGPGSRLDADFWSSALSQEVHFFLSALPEHDDLPSRLVDILGALHLEVWRKDRDTYDLSDLQKAALFNLTGVCLSHVGQASKVPTTLEFVLSHSSELITDAVVRRACARGLGIVAQRHFDLVLSVLGRHAKTDAATRRAGSIAQSLFGKSTAVQQAEYLRAMLTLALGYCAVYAPNPEVLQEQVCEHILGPLHLALTQERAVPVLQSVVEAVKLANDAIRMSPETMAMRDPFLSPADQAMTDVIAAEGLETRIGCAAVVDERAELGHQSVRREGSRVDIDYTCAAHPEARAAAPDRLNL